MISFYHFSYLKYNPIRFCKSYTLEVYFGENDSSALRFSWISFVTSGLNDSKETIRRSHLPRIAVKKWAEQLMILYFWTPLLNLCVLHHLYDFSFPPIKQTRPKLQNIWRIESKNIANRRIWSKLIGTMKPNNEKSIIWKIFL